MSQLKISVSIPHLEREYDVNLPGTVTGERLYKAIIDRTDALKESEEDVYELFSKRVGKKIYPDYKGNSLVDVGIKEGDTIIVRRDMDPGGTR